MQQLTNGLTPALDALFDTFLDEHPQETFLFRLVSAGEFKMPVQTAEGVEMTPVNPSRHVHGSTKIRDEKGRLINLVYAIGQDEKVVNGVTQLVDRPESIWFESRAHCIVTVQRYEREKLIRLLFSDECRNSLNPYATANPSGPVYEFVEPAKTAEKAVIDEEAILDAKLAVRRATDSEAAEACARLTLPVSQDRNANTKTLYSAAEADPRGVVAVLGDEWNQTTALVRDLTSAGIIAFDEAARTYRTVADQKAFHNVLTGDFETSLVKYLSDAQGQKIKGALSRQLEAATKKGGKR